MLRKAFWLFGLMVALLVIFLPGYTKLQELREKNSDLEVRIKALGKENQELLRQLKLTESDALYQEKIAREKMGVVRKGEIPIRVISEEKKR